jgi:hypothetical protein
MELGGFTMLDGNFALSLTNQRVSSEFSPTVMSFAAMDSWSLVVGKSSAVDDVPNV